MKSLPSEVFFPLASQPASQPLIPSWGHKPRLVYLVGKKEVMVNGNLPSPTPPVTGFEEAYLPQALGLWVQGQA